MDPEKEKKEAADESAATQTDEGAAEEESQDEVEYHDPQAGAREAIASRRRQELIEDGLDLEPEPEPEPAAAEEQDDPGPEGEEAEPPVEESDEELVEIKVDGVTEKVKKSEVDEAGGIRALQKERAASKRLQEAAERQKNLDRREKELAEKEAAMSGKKPGAEGGDQPPPAGGFSDEEIAEIANQLSYGDEEDAAKAVKRLLAAGGIHGSHADHADTQQIAAQVTAQIQGQTVLQKFQSAPEEGGFSDLMDTRLGTVETVVPAEDGSSRVVKLPIPYVVARDEVNRLVQEDGADPTSWETYKQAGDTVIKRFGLRKGANPTGGQSKKHERKRSTDHPKGAAPPAKPAQDFEQSLDEKRRGTIHEMAKNRTPPGRAV